MSTIHRNLHGVRISIELDDSAIASRCQDLFPTLWRLPVADRGAAALSIRCAARSAQTTEGGSAPLFFHGRTQGCRESSAMVLSDGASRVRVDDDGREIQVAIDPRSLEDGYTFANATLFIALMLALRAHGLFHLHAAALVDDRERAVLVAGEGGSGKTTSTLSFIAEGWAWLGDDSVLIEQRTGRVLGLPKTFHVDDRSIALYPEHHAHLKQRYRENHDKRALDASAAFGQQCRDSASPPRILLFPEIRAVAKTDLEPLSHAEAFGLLLHSAALIMVDGVSRVREQMEALRHIVSGAESYRLTLGRDMLSKRGVLSAALAHARRESA
jgi:hypothetical protein